MCHACHKGVHLECLQNTRTVDRQEREDILDSEIQWRCADCVSKDRFRPSAIMEEFAQIHGKGRMLLIKWSGHDMAEDSLTYKDHLETDYTGLQAQLTRRRTIRSSRRQDRYGKSILACKCAPVGVQKIRRLDTLGLDPIRSRWKQGTGDDQTYHEWRMTHPGVRRALDVPHQREWKPMVHMAVRSRNCKATEQLTLMVKGLTDLLKETLTWKWYQASVRMRDSKRAPTCVGLGMEVQDFVAAVQQELSWWPSPPVPDWLKTRIRGDAQCPVAESLIDEKFRVQEADIDFTLVQEIREWAQEQVELLEDHQWNDNEERALMADRRHTQSQSEAEQLQIWEFDEIETE